MAPALGVNGLTQSQRYGVQCGKTGRTWWKARVALVVTAQLQRTPPPAVAAMADGPGRIVLRVAFRSASPKAASALASDLPTTLRELFAGAFGPWPHLCAGSCVQPCLSIHAHHSR